MVVVRQKWAKRQKRELTSKTAGEQYRPYCLVSIRTILFPWRVEDGDDCAHVAVEILVSKILNYAHSRGREDSSGFIRCLSADKLIILGRRFPSDYFH